MQKIGRKSIVTEITVPNYLDSSDPFIVKVQANKHHGICDIVLGTMISKEITDSKTKKKTVNTFFPTRHISEALTKYQGRQYDNPVVIESLTYFLCEILNPEQK